MDFGYELKTFRSKDILILEVHGELTSLKSRDFFENACQFLTGEYKGLLIDLSQVHYLDSMGLGSCIRIFAICDGKGWGKGLQVKADGTMDSLVNFADISRIAPIFKNRDRALHSLYMAKNIKEEAQILRK